MWKRRPGNIPWSRPLADLVQTAINPVLRRQGFGQSDLVLFWDDIVGERLAAMSQPVKVRWPVRQRRAAEDDPAPATLIVRVETGFALELQHLAPVVIERVNAHFGWRCVSRLLLKQGPVVAAPPLARHGPRPLDKAAEAAAETIVGSVTDEPLRLALTRLGARILAGP